jgi:23S rRNA pseudouridine1911/1915/1917 synthase
VFSGPLDVSLTSNGPSFLAPSPNVPPSSDPASQASPLTTVVPQDQDGVRLDQFWMGHSEDLGVARSRVQSWIKNGLALINDAPCLRPGRRLSPGDRLELRAAVPISGLTPENHELHVLYHDDDLAILNKPADLVVHPAAGLDQGTLVHRLLHHFPDLAGKHAGGMDTVRPGIVHRLDKDTTGLLAVALNEPARLRLASAFAAREVEKAYLALVHGRPRAQGIVDAPIGRHPTLKTRMAVTDKGGKPAHSSYKVLWTAPEDRFSLIQVRIASGRTHQIRVHMRHVGHPLLGDPTYCPSSFTGWQDEVPGLNVLLRRPMLHAWKLGLPHPRTHQPLSFVLPPPKDMLRVILAGSRTTQRIGLTGMPGCGKSLFLTKLSAQGLPTWSADKTVAELYQPGRDGWELLRRNFGDRFIPDPEGPVDKRALLNALRETPGLRRELEALIHPLARHHLEDFWQAHRKHRVAVAEVPLLLETGWPSDFDLIVGLVSDPDRRRSWLRTNRGWDESLLADMESWQWPEAKKIRACHLVVANPGTRDELAQRARSLVDVLQWLRRQGVRRVLARITALVDPERDASRDQE